MFVLEIMNQMLLCGNLLYDRAPRHQLSSRCFVIETNILYIKMLGCASLESRYNGRESGVQEPASRVQSPEFQDGRK